MEEQEIFVVSKYDITRGGWIEIAHARSKDEATSVQRMINAVTVVTSRRV